MYSKFIKLQYSSSLLADFITLRIEAGVSEPTNQHPIAFSALPMLVWHQKEHTASKYRVMSCWHDYLSALMGK